MEDKGQRVQSSRKGTEKNPIPYLPPEIICKIVARLPIESILSCRCVCKAWYALMKDSNFIDMHLDCTCDKSSKLMIQSHTDENSLFLLDMEQHKARKIPFEIMQFPFQGESELLSPRIMSSYNGLLCIGLRKDLDPVTVFNPLTRECMLLPPLRLKIHLHSHHLGIGFDPLSGKYNVVREHKKCHGNNVSKIMITTLGESSWRELSPPDHLVENRMGASVFWNGAFHWKIADSDGKYSNQWILSYDIPEEKFYTISCASIEKPGQPVYDPYNDRDYYHMYYNCYEVTYEIRVFGESLNLVEHNLHVMKVWEVTGNKTEGFSIYHKYSYDTYARWNRDFGYATITQPNDNKFWLQVRNILSRRDIQRVWFVEFSPKTAQYKYLDIPGIPIEFVSVFYVPSFVSLVEASQNPTLVLSVQELFHVLSN